MPADAFLQQHLAALQASDAGAAADLYHDDATMLSFEWTADGRDAIRDHYRSFFEYHGEIARVDVDRNRTAGDRLFSEITLESARGRFQLVNAFVLDGDRARDHFSNVVDGQVNADEAQG